MYMENVLKVLGVLLLLCFCEAAQHKQHRRQQQLRKVARKRRKQLKDLEEQHGINRLNREYQELLEKEALSIKRVPYDNEVARLLSIGASRNYHDALDRIWSPFLRQITEEYLRKMSILTTKHQQFNAIELREIQRLKVATLPATQIPFSVLAQAAKDEQQRLQKLEGLNVLADMAGQKQKQQQHQEHQIR